ncbi:MAG: YlxR family protein [Clostridia bacterium]
MQRQPQRTCMGCNSKKDQNELIRISKNKNNEININENQKLDGRGAYLCSNIKCLEKVMKTKRIERIFGIQISDEIYEKLRGVILDK